MTSRERAPVGAPCWADLSTSDADGARKFYGELFGWEPQEPNAEFGGYFQFNRNGTPVAGGMGPMGDMPGQNRWQVYFATDDIEAALKAAAAEGAEILSPAMAVGDLGFQGILVDPTGAPVGMWQPGSFQGFGVLSEPGTPSWFELQTSDHARAVAFYQTVFGSRITPVSDDDAFRYTMLADAEGAEGDLAGVMDAKNFLPEGTGSNWSVYWAVDDTAATLARVGELGGSVTQGPDDTPYGVLATCLDPFGAQFKLRTPPA